MKLDRNNNPQRIGKYALIKLRNVPEGWPKFTENSSGNEFVSFPSKCLDFGDTPDTEFFVIRLKDRYASPALHAYATSCECDDPEYAAEVRHLANVARHHPKQQKPT